MIGIETPYAMSGFYDTFSRISFQSVRKAVPYILS